MVVVVALALGGCGLDRTGLENVLLGDGGTSGNGDAAADRIGGGAGGNGGSGGSLVGTGGDSGAGGVIIVDGSGGSGGIMGAGGMIIGTGGMPGAGGIIGAGGKIVGAGGMIIGTGGMPGAGGIMGAGGKIVGTGGSTDGGTDAGAGGAGTGGAGLGGNPGGPDGGPGTGGAGAGGMGAAGAPGLGGAGGAPICTPGCGPCQRCSATHTCELDPASFWDLSAVFASIKPEDPRVMSDPMNWDGASGEVGGVLPDPFVEFDILTTSVNPVGHTTPITDTLQPNWAVLIPQTQALLNPPGSPILASDLLAGGKHWQIVVYDDDQDTNAGPFGESICTIFDPLTPADFVSFTRNDVGSCTSVSMKLTCHP